MRFALLLLLISVSAFAQQKNEPAKKDKPVKFSDYDSLDLDFDWKKEVFKMWDCYCPWLNPDSVQAMPREFSPYKWVNKDKPIIISDSTYNQWIKDDLWFKKFLRVDSTQLIKKKITVL
jgi:hypothetical protein